MSKISDILKVKGSTVLTIEAQASVREAGRRMIELNVGSLVVEAVTGKTCGIITERDILWRFVDNCHEAADETVEGAMTREVIVCTPDCSIDRARTIMKNQHVRYLPIVAESGDLVGIVSIGDVNAHLLVEDETELKYLHDYVEQRL